MIELELFGTYLGKDIYVGKLGDGKLTFCVQHGNNENCWFDNLFSTQKYIRENADT